MRIGVGAIIDSIITITITITIAIRIRIIITVTVTTASFDDPIDEPGWAAYDGGR